MSESSNLGKPNNQSGYVLIVLCLLLVVLFAFIAFAIDLAEVSHTKWALQRAGDAGVLSSLSYRAKVGWTATSETINKTQTNLPLKILTNSVAANLKDRESWHLTNCEDLNKPPRDTNQVCASNAPDTNDLQYNLINDQASIRLTRRVPLFFGKVIPGIPSDIVVGMNAGQSSTATLAPVAVIVLADVSGSMNGQKIIDLRNSLKAFVRFFNPARDRIAIVKYSTRAELVWPLTWTIQNTAVSPKPNFPCGTWVLADQDRYCTIDGVIDSLVSSGSANTNMGDAFYEGTFELNRALPQLAALSTPINNVTYVLFSDGAPTAGTFAFKGPVDSNAKFSASSSFNMLSYKLTSRIASTPSNVTITYPSPPLIFDRRATNLVEPNYNLYFSWLFNRTNPYLYASFASNISSSDWNTTAIPGFGFYNEHDGIPIAQGSLSFCNSGCQFVENPALRTAMNITSQRKCSLGRTVHDKNHPIYDTPREPKCNLLPGVVSSNTRQPIILSVANEEDANAKAMTLIKQEFGGIKAANGGDYLYNFCVPTCEAPGSLFGDINNLGSNYFLTTNFDLATYQNVASNYAKMYYSNALLWADYIRSLANGNNNLQSVRIYTVGLGESKGSTSLFGENLVDDEERKDAFMARLANDPLGQTMYLNATNEEPRYEISDNAFTQNRNQFCPLDSASIKFDQFGICGEYRPVDDPAQLVGAFASIGRAIALRLVQ